MKEELSHKSSEETGLLEIEQTEYYTGKDRHLQILEGYPNVSSDSNQGMAMKRPLS